MSRVDLDIEKKEFASMSQRTRRSSKPHHAGATKRTRALQSLKELCDSGLLPETLYQQNVATIQQSNDPAIQ